MNTVKNGVEMSKKSILSLACVVVLGLEAAEESLLKILGSTNFHISLRDFGSLSNANGSVSAISSVYGTLYADNSVLGFGDIQARDNAVGIRGNAFSFVRFSSGVIYINSIRSSQKNAYGISTDSIFSLRLYYGILPMASIYFGGIQGERNAYGLKAPETLTIKGGGLFGRSDLEFGGGITAKTQDAYGVEAKAFKLGGMRLRFYQPITAGRDVYGIKTGEKALIQESKIVFSDLIAKRQAVGISAGESVLVETEETSQRSSSISFGAIKGESAYGILATTLDFSLRNSKLHFSEISGTKMAYGLQNQGSKYLLEGTLFGNGEGDLGFGRIVSSAGEAAGIHNILEGNTLTISDGSLHFGNIQGKTSAYGIKGAMDLRARDDAIRKERHHIRFDSILAESGNAYGIYTDKSATISLSEDGILEFGSISAPLGKAYGIYATGNMVSGVTGSLFPSTTVTLRLTDSVFQARLEGDGEIFHSEIGGEIELELEDDSRLVLEGNGGKVDSLSVEMRSFVGQGNVIDLSGAYGSWGVRSRKHGRAFEIGNYYNSSRKPLVVGLYVNLSEGISDKISIHRVRSGYQDITLQVFYHLNDLRQPPKQTPKQPQELLIASLSSDLRVNEDPWGTSKDPKIVKSRVKMGFGDVITTIYRRNGANGIYDYVINTAERPSFEINAGEAERALGLFGSAYGLHFYNLRQISKRLGTLRKGYDRGGVWAHTNAGMGVSSQLDVFSAFGFEAGGDFVFELGSWSAYVGGNFTYSRAFESSIVDHTQGFEGGIYGGLMNEGLYYYAQVKAEYFESVAGGNGITSLNQSFLTLSQELGYRIEAGRLGGLYWEPKTQLDLSVSLPSSYSKSDGSDTLRSSLGVGGIVNVRLGADLGYNFVRSSSLKSDLYLGLYYEMNALLSSGVSFESDFSHSTQEIPAKLYHNLLFSLGSHIEASKNLKLFMDLDFGVGGGFFPVAKGSFGAKYVF